MTMTYVKRTTDSGKKPVPLPTIYKGNYTEVKTLTMAERRQLGLSTPETIVQVTTDEGLKEILEYAKKKGSITVDSETGYKENEEDALDPWKGSLELMQFGDSERQFLVWVRYITDWSPIIELLGDNAICKKGQNLKFDMKFWLVKRGIEKRWWNVADAGIMDQVLGCGLFSEEDDSVGMTLKLTSMEWMARRWLGLQIVKDEDTRVGWHLYTPETLPLEKLLYAADDVVYPEKIIARQKPWIKRFGLVETVNLEHAFIPVAADMELRGMLMDMEKWDALAAEQLDKANKSRRALDHLFKVTVTVEIDENEQLTISRDKKYTSKDHLKELLREYMMEHHGVTIVACNKHFKEALVANGFMPERAEKLFETKKVPNPKKPGKNKIVGGPMMTDHCDALWEDYKSYLPKNSMYLPNTKSGTFKLNRIIFETPKEKLDSELPNRIGIPPAIVDPILEMRKSVKAYGTYGPNWHKLVNPITGRVHFEFIQAALTTGRLSSWPNAQNLPGNALYRACFIADKRKKASFIGSDFDQVEPRILAQLSNCFTYKRVFFSKHPERPEYQVYCQGVKEALDLYTEIGKMIGVIPMWMSVKETKGGDGVEPTKEGKKGRKQAKIVVLGLGYGTGKAKFYITLVVDLGEVVEKPFSDNLWDSFWDALPELKAKLNELSNLAYPGDDVVKGRKIIRQKSKRRLWHPFTECEVTWAETLGGRKRFYRPTSFAWWTTGRNQPIQGTGADLLKRTMVVFARWCWANLAPEYGLVNSIHDELLAEVPTERDKECLAKMEEIMMEVGNAYCPDTPITAAGYVADFWVKD